MDYDGFHTNLPVLGTASGVTMNGQTFTGSIDTLGWREITFIATLGSAIAYSALPTNPWSFQESDDNVNFTSPVDPALTLFSLPPLATSPNQDVLPNPPSGLTTQASTSQVFHGSYIGKKRYVKAAFNSGNQFVATPAAWTGGGTPTAIPSATAVSPAVAGTYVVNTDFITSGSVVVSQNQLGAPANGVLTISSIATVLTNTGLTQYTDGIFRLVCNVGGASGSFDLFDPTGVYLGTLFTGATTKVFLDRFQLPLFSLAITNGATGWVAGQVIQLEFTDMGVNSYTLLNPSGQVVGHPFGKVAFSGGGLSFTIPDTPTAVAVTTDTCNIVVTATAVTGQIVGLFGHPWSAPVWQYADEQTLVAVAQ